MAFWLVTICLGQGTLLSPFQLAEQEMEFFMCRQHELSWSKSAPIECIQTTKHNRKLCIFTIE